MGAAAAANPDFDLRDDQHETDGDHDEAAKDAKDARIEAGGEADRRHEHADCNERQRNTAGESQRS